MHALPLITHERADAVIAWRDGKPITAAEFLRAAQALAARLPAGSHALNLCADRYHFTVAIAASLLRGQCSLLPSTHAPEVIRHLQALAPDMFCLTDGNAGREILSELRCPMLRVNAGAGAISAPGRTTRGPAARGRR